MIGQAIVTSGALAMFSVLLGWLLIGGMHDSAHPNGERPHFEILIVGWNYTEGLLHKGPPPTGWALRLGPSYHASTWGLDLVWGRNDRANLDAGDMPWLHWFQLHVGRWSWPHVVWSYR